MSMIVDLSLWIDIASKTVFDHELTSFSWLVWWLVSSILVLMRAFESICFVNSPISFLHSNILRPIPSIEFHSIFHLYWSSPIQWFLYLIKMQAFNDLNFIVMINSNHIGWGVGRHPKLVRMNQKCCGNGQGTKAVLFPFSCKLRPNCPLFIATNNGVCRVQFRTKYLLRKRAFG